MHRLPPISTDDWMDNQLFFDEKTAAVWPQQVVLDEVGKATGEKTLVQKFDHILLCHDGYVQSRWLDIWT